MDQHPIAGHGVELPHAPHNDADAAHDLHAELHVNNLNAGAAPLDQPAAGQDMDGVLAQQSLEDLAVIAVIQGQNPGTGEQDTPRVTAVRARVDKLKEEGQWIQTLEMAMKESQRQRDKERFLKTKKQEERKRRS